VNYSFNVIPEPLYCSGPLPDTIEYHSIVKIPNNNSETLQPPVI